MTTFGLPMDSFDSVEDVYYPQGDDAPKQVPDVDIVSPHEEHFLSSDDSGYGKFPTEDPNALIDEAARMVAGSPLIATQPLTQSQPRPYDPDYDRHLVGLLIPATGNCEHFELSKDMTSWRIGRNANNDLILPGNKISNFHCTLHWNGKEDKQSEVILVDSSSNGTWVNNVLVGKDSTIILRGGASICFGGQPDAPNSDWRFIFRDIEGQSTAHMKQIWAKYDVGHELGAGAFARVHKCIERATGVEYAVKIIDRTKLRRSHASEAAVVREIRILKQLADFRHKNIVALREHFEEEDSIYLILELVRGGDLLNYIATNGALPEQQVRRMAAQICHAVAYIHSQGITHRDLKPENVMITASLPPDCKVADFGLAKLVGSGTFLKTMCGTPAYLAPEVMLRGNPRQAYDNRVDSWSLGIIFYCMLTNHTPFHKQYDPQASPAEQRQYFGDRQVDWNLLNVVNLSEEGHDFLRRLLAVDPRNRASVAAMLDHSWIAALVPSESQFQHPLPLTPVTPATDGDACKSMENLNLSDIPIPGLSLVHDGGVRQSSEYAGAARMPGAYPVTQPGPPLSVINEQESWEAARDVGTKRKNFIEGSSPLSSLTPSEDEREEVKRPEPVVRSRRATAPRKPPSARRRRAEEQLVMPRRSMRRQPHAIKSARYI